MPPSAGARAPGRTRALALVVALLLLAACDRAPEDAADVLRVGAGSTAEQQLLAALTAEVLAQAGVAVEVTGDLGDTRGVREAATGGQVDVVWDYTGAAWTLGLERGAPAVDPQESFEAVAAEDEANGLRWLGPSQADAALALFVAEDDLPEGEEPTVSWLAGQLGQQADPVCAPAAFLEAPGGWAYLADTYAIATDLVRTRAADEAEAVEAVAADRCLAGLAPATSGLARAAGLMPLVDDQQVFPALVVAPVVVEGSLADAPQVAGVLDRVARDLGTADLATLNAQVAGGAPVATVAEAYIASTGSG